MKREYRYIIIKVKDAKEYLSESDGEQLDRILNRIDKGRARDGKLPLDCVVVEHDWPEYEPTWAAIAARVDGGVARIAADIDRRIRFGVDSVIRQSIKDKLLKAVEEI